MGRNLERAKNPCGGTGERGEEERVSRRLRPWKEVVAIRGRKEAQILGLVLSYARQSFDSRYAERVAHDVTTPSPSSISVLPLPRDQSGSPPPLPCPPSPPRVGTDSLVDAPRTTLRYTFLSTYVVSSPASSVFSRVQGLPSPANGNPLVLANLVDTPASTL